MYSCFKNSWTLLVLLCLFVSSLEVKAQYDRQYYIDFGAQFFMDEDIKYQDLIISKRVNFNSTFGDFYSLNSKNKIGYGLGMGATRLIENPVDPSDPKFDYERRTRISLNFLVHANYKYVIMKKTHGATYFNAEGFLCLDSFQVPNLNPGFNLGFSYEGIASHKFFYEITAYIGYTHARKDVSTLGGRTFGLKVGLVRRPGRF